MLEIPNLQNANFDILFEQQKTGSHGKSLLLHVCCAPCATQCLTRLLDTFDITLYYSNDNITDIAEWNKRLTEVQKLVKIANNGDFEVQPLHPLKLVVQQADSAKFYNVIQGLEREKEGGARCAQCFKLRLSDTRQYALQNNFDFFSTTLTVSPYKNTRLLNTIGLGLQTENLEWLCSDFKKHNGYNESIRLANKYGLYRQHYCGCEFSIQS